MILDEFVRPHEKYFRERSLGYIVVPQAWAPFCNGHGLF
jgi:hypothetical protein